jgi:biopolymer transport protein ExbD
VTPVLDMIFLVLAVLLVVFAKLTPVEGLPTVLGPERNGVRGQERSQRVEVTLQADGRVAVNGQDVALDDLESAVEAHSRQTGVDAVYLLAQSQVPYGAVAEVLVLLQDPRHPPVFLGMSRRPPEEP